MKNTLNITIYDVESSVDDPPGKLIEHIAWLRSKLEEIPEEFRSSARVEIYGSESYGSGVLCYTIKYHRQETDEEEARREATKKAADDAQTQRELATLKALQDKYGSLPNAKGKVSPE